MLVAVQKQRQVVWVNNFLWSQGAGQAYTIVTEPHSHVGNSHLEGAVNVNRDPRNVFYCLVLWEKPGKPAETPLLLWQPASAPGSDGFRHACACGITLPPFHGLQRLSVSVGLLQGAANTPAPCGPVPSSSYCLSHVDNSCDVGPVSLCGDLNMIWGQPKTVPIVDLREMF